MGIMLHCTCNKCGKRFMEFEDKIKGCPYCGSEDYEIKFKAPKDIDLV